MSRITAGNIFRVVLAFVFWLFVAFYVLVIGIGAKNKKVMFEGGCYAAVFIAAVSLGSSGAIVGLAAMGLSAVRSYMLRDLWLPRRVRKSERGNMVHEHATMPPPAQSYPTATSLPGASDNLSSALAWVSAKAKQNKHRLPGDTYVTILETCQMLDSVIDAEILQPSGDARFEYELEAVVREYLPTVLRGFLAIPPSMVDNRQPNGRTPNEELVEQLGLLLGQAETLHSTRHSQTSSDLTTTGNFLRERFGHHQQGGFDFGIK
ncbi:hypothetical protein GCM10009715_04970 [Paeniglutamicibacter psychrophenolicus]|uniref:Defect at low temperature protein 1 n=1 Tax=Paeniglutamicibacter psychrophenolicus TaxID=257454 RepID=A0ABS4WDL4_9MICC|nr:hypothetical protein [Paeniglutamicibacter psychrophenolicus]MBP2374296.1 hypothetical protein [Paeniglutamicibacter psychrophenolicus]